MIREGSGLYGRIHSTCHAQTNAGISDRWGNTRLMLLNDSAADVFGNRSLLGLIRSAFARGLGESDFERSGAAGLLCPRGRKKARDYYTPTAIHAALQRGLIPFCQTMFPVISHIFISFLSFYLHCFILFIISFFLWWFIKFSI